jgi:hypothetical protein
MQAATVAKTRDARGRPRSESSLLGHPDAKFSVEKEKGAKKKGRPVETDATDGNPHTPRIPTLA